MEITVGTGRGLGLAGMPAGYLRKGRGHAAFPRR
jgi:hypothetical protein